MIWKRSFQWWWKTAGLSMLFPRFLQRNLHARQLLGMLFLAALQHIKPSSNASMRAWMRSQNGSIHHSLKALWSRSTYVAYASSWSRVIVFLLAVETIVHPVDRRHILWQLLLCVQSRSCQDWTSTCVWLEPILPKLSQYLWATCTHHQSTHDTWYCTSISLFNPLWPFGCFGRRGSRDVIYSELTGWNPTPAVLQDQLVTAVRPPLEKK